MATKVWTTAVIGKDFRDKNVRGGKAHLTVILEDSINKAIHNEVFWIKRRYFTTRGYDSVATLSGRLRKSVQGEVHRTQGGGVSSSVSVGGGVPYANVQIGDKPTIITPSVRNFLAVPLPRALTKKGELLARFRSVSTLYDVKSLHRQGQALGEGSGDSFIPYFALRKRVVVPARVKPMVLLESVKGSVQAAIDEALGRFEYTYLRSGIK